ncbi:MAG: transporter substrate-binding domain-containing protein [Desulfobacterales bacterium]|nr:transporter substrate-binding domain-containing protein [Desulfobacterales bacterium]
MKQATLTLAVLILILQATPLIAGEKLVLSTFESDPFVTTAVRIIQEAYKRSGIEAEIRHYPGERAVNMANHGKTDGEVFRVAGIDKQYKNLHMVPIAITGTEIVVFSKAVNFQVKGWDSLKPYKISFLKGFKMAEAKTQGMKVFPTGALEALFKVLDKGRVDIVIESRIGGLSFIKKYGFTGIKPLEPPLETVKVYHYLHKKHQYLVPRITKVLEEMDSKGILKEIKQNVINEFF